MVDRRKQDELTCRFIRREDAYDFKGIGWDALLNVWLTLIPVSGRFKPVNGFVVALEDLTARKGLCKSDPLDLDHLSTRGE